MDLNLVECADPATVHIEVYSPRQSLYGSLDASVYTCAAHAAATRDAIHAMKLTAFQRHDPPAVERTCGAIFDYTTLGKEEQ